MPKLLEKRSSCVWVYHHDRSRSVSRTFQSQLRLDRFRFVALRHLSMMPTWWFLRTHDQAAAFRCRARSYVVTVDQAWGLAKTHKCGKSRLFVTLKVKREGERGRSNFFFLGCDPHVRGNSGPVRVSFRRFHAILSDGESMR